MTIRTQILDGETLALAGAEASPPAQAAAWNVFAFPSRNAALGWGEEASSSDDYPPPQSIGELAVRIVGNFALPRLLVLEQVSMQRREE